MTYYDSAEGHTVTQAQAQQLCIRHYAEWAHFLACLGDHPEYDAQAVLRWLGY